MRIVLSTFGSFGDIHPYMAVAMELQSRGHEPVIATSDVYREKIEAAGLTIFPVRPDLPQPGDQAAELINRILEPKTGPRFLMEEVIYPGVRDGYHDLTEAVRGADLLVTHPAAPAGPLVGHKTGMPWISTVLAPFSFFSAYDPPVPPFWQWMSKVSLLGPGFVKFALDLAKSGHKAKVFDEFRKELGVADYGNPIFEGQHSPTLVLALFSKVFAQPQPDWPQPSEVAGFCFYDGRPEAPMPAELAQFLDSGPPPIVFTFGSSAVWIARDFFRESIEAARRLGQRAVVLVGDDRNRPSSLPDGMIAIDYAPYETLLPRASVVIHHGGVGTTAQGLLAGVPTLIVPFAFDQSDNADRAQRLGTSRTVYRNKYRADHVAKELNQLLTRPDYKQNAAHISSQLKQENGPARAADLIEKVLSKTPLGHEELVYAASD
jgi:MGT family glycosyltransferase